MSNKNAVKPSPSSFVPISTVNFVHPLRVVFLLLLLLVSVTAPMWTGAASERKADANSGPHKGERMLILDKDSKPRVIDLSGSSRPHFDESVFDSTEMQTGNYRGKSVKFITKDGWAIIDGDIAIGRADNLIGGTDLITFEQNRNMWLKTGSVFQIPYTITSGNSNIPIAISYFNTTFSGIIQWVPRTAEPDYVDFNFDPNDYSGYGFSALGRAGGQQQLGGSIALTVQGLLHEMGHAVGLYHEQQRTDRATYVEFHPENMSNSTRWTSYPLGDYFQLDRNIQDVGLYEYASTMHYYWNNLAKNDGPVFESIPHGIQIARYPPNSMTGDYSEGDIDAIKRLYDSAPTLVTVTSNPPGLQVIVDGATITTPQTFNWALNSTHSLSVPAGGQTLGNKAYTYGRWNDNAAATHSITVASGDGRRVLPYDKPAVTVYSANFINLIKFTESVFPAGTGSMTAMPAAQSYPGLTGLYYVARQPVTLQGTPNAGQNFYAWFGVPLYSFSGNPQTFRWDIDVAEVSAQAGFSDQPLYTFTTNFPNNRLYVFVDGNFWYAPVNYSPFYDPGWGTGTMHTVNTDSLQYPFYFTTRYPFQNWSDGGAQSHSITLPATNTTYAANFNTQYRVIVDSPCGGTPSVSPFSADGYYNSGTPITVSQTPDPGYVFTGWLEDLTGTASPQMVTLNGELYSSARYNVNSTPFSVTSFNPSSVAQNSPGFTLTINGTGFTPDRTFVDVNGTYTPHNFINSSQITVPVQASDLTIVGGIPILVQNFPNGATCGVYNVRTLAVKISVPTAANVSVGGRVTTPDGQSIARVRVTITNMNGIARTALTNAFGYYRFEDIEAGQTYIVSAQAKRYSFNSRVLTVLDELTDLDIIALPAK